MSITSIPVKQKVETTSEKFRKKFLVTQEERPLIQEKEEDLLSRDFLDRKTGGIYRYVKKIDNHDILKYFVLAIIIFSIINRMEFTIKNIIALLLTAFVIYFLNDRHQSINITDMEEIALKLNKLKPKPEYFYYDVGFIEIFYSMKEMRDYNHVAWDNAIKISDNFLKVKRRIEKLLKPEYTDYRSLKDFKRDILNNMQSIIYNLPTKDDTLTLKLRKGIRSLHFLLNMHINQVKEFYNDTVDLENLTYKDHIIEDNGNVESNDFYKDDPHFNVY